MDVMIDLETLGTSPNSVILSVGLVAFTDDEIIDKLEVFITLDSQQEREISHNTLKWWLNQSKEARNALVEGMDRAIAMSLALMDIEHFFSKLGDDVKVWGNGSDFDNAILIDAFGGNPPWHYWNNRCYRTVKKLYNHVKTPERKGVHHNAVDDAEYQALHLMEIRRNG